MTDKTVTMSRELARLLYQDTVSCWGLGGNAANQLSVILVAAPVVERQLASLLVWEGSMPESNGKSNFTVILHTGDLTEGICVYRSEYPDRARYEADCFRHLIGDPAFPEKPFICDYDADKHSGYVKPDTSPPAPVAAVTREQVEIVAESIYWQWAGREGFVPWVKGGNSLKQDEARSIAWSTLDKLKELNQ